MARILLIEDNLSYRYALSEALLSFGHTVTEAVNGKEALKLLPTADPELIITDIVMPEFDGIELLVALRTRRAPVKVIAMSAGGMRPATEYLNLAKVLGAAKVLQKPFDLLTLKEAIAELLPVPA